MVVLYWVYDIISLALRIWVSNLMKGHAEKEGDKVNDNIEKNRAGRYRVWDFWWI